MAAEVGNQGGESGVLRKVSERELPAHCADAFDLFEDQLEHEIDSQPPWLNRPLSGIEAVYFPAYSSIKPASWLGILGMVGLLSFLVVLAMGLLVLVVTFALPESLMRPAAYALLVLGGLAFVVLNGMHIRSELRENRRKRAHGRPSAFGTFLLPEAMVERYATGCYYYPRASILEVFEKPIRGGGGAGRPTRTIGFSCEIRYRDALGRERTTGAFSEVSTWHHSPNGPRTKRVRKWYAETG